MNRLSITSKEISSLIEMDRFFESYCKSSGIALDFTKGPCCNGYIEKETANAFVWFIRGCFRAIGDEHLEMLLKQED